MRCIYCGFYMKKIRSWAAKDYQDFSEENYICPNCDAECDVSEPYGAEWYSGRIEEEEGSDEL